MKTPFSVILGILLCSTLFAAGKTPVDSTSNSSLAKKTFPVATSHKLAKVPPAMLRHPPAAKKPAHVVANHNHQSKPIPVNDKFPGGKVGTIISINKASKMVILKDKKNIIDTFGVSDSLNVGARKNRLMITDFSAGNNVYLIYKIVNGKRIAVKIGKMLPKDSVLMHKPNKTKTTKK